MAGRHKKKTPNVKQSIFPKRSNPVFLQNGDEVSVHPVMPHMGMTSQ